MNARSWRSLRPLVGLVVIAVIAGVACARRAPPPPPVPAPAPPVVATNAPAPAARPRPALALFYSSDVRGRVTCLPSPTAPKLPPGIWLSPLAAHETIGGLARRATLVDRGRVAAAAVVQVDAGDFLPVPTDEPRDVAAPTPKDFGRWVDLVIASYRRLGVDAVTLGERELGAPAPLDPRRLAAKLAAAHVPVVLANLVDRKHARVFPAHAVINGGGADLSVGVFGVTELDAAATARLAEAGYTLTSAEAAARDEASALRAAGAKLVVALVHASAGRARAVAIAAAAPDIDYVVVSAGHDPAPVAASPDGGAAPNATSTSTPTPTSTSRPKVLVADGDTVGRLDVRVAAAGPTEISDTVLTFNKDVPEQLGVNLLSRAITMPVVDSQALLAEAARTKKTDAEKFRDIYEPWTFASTEACGFCHPKETVQWKTTDHALAVATLTRVKHDHDPACLGCHTMGFLQSGGTHDIFMTLHGFANVGCESCHGPSAVHVRSVNKKKGTSQAVDPVLCLGCHTPDQNRGPFDVLEAMKEIVGPGHGPGVKP